MSLPVASGINSERVRNQVKTLMQLLCEIDECEVIVAGDNAKLVVRNNGGISRGIGRAHNGLIAELFYAITKSEALHGKDYFKVPLQPEEIVIRKEYLALVRDDLLQRELERFLLSKENERYLLENESLKPLNSLMTHPTDSRSSLRSPVAFSDIVQSVSCQRNYSSTSRSIEVKVKLKDLRASGEIEGYIRNFFNLGEEERIGKISLDTFVLNIREEHLDFVLENLKQQKKHYHGLILEDENGEILMADRRSFYRSGAPHLLGKATSGGQCCHPYSAFTSAIAELEEEFGLKLKNAKMLAPSEDERDVMKGMRFLPNNSDSALLVADLNAFGKKVEGTEFDLDESEFVKGSAAMISFAEMRKKEIPLRAIPCIELYLQDYEVGINNLLESFGISAKIPSICRLSPTGEVKFPDKNFGRVEFYGTNKEWLQNIFGGEPLVLKDRIIIDDLNPRQIYEGLYKFLIKSERSPEIFEEYRRVKKGLTESALEYDEASVKSATRIQHEFRGFISRKRIRDGDLGIDIKAKSQENLATLKARLGTLDERESLLLKKLSEIDLSANHCASIQSLTSALNTSDPKLFDVKELQRRRMIKEGAVPALENKSKIGTERSVFFTIGSSNAGSPYLKVQEKESRNAMITMNLDSMISKNPATWMGENFLRYKNMGAGTAGNLLFNMYKIGDTVCSVGVESDKIVHRFTRKDGSFALQSMKLGEEVCFGDDIREFLSLRFIEKLRLIGGSAREYLLSDIADANAINKVMNDMLFYSNCSLHIPTEVSIKDAELFNVCKANQSKVNAEVMNYIYGNNIAGLELLSRQYKGNLAYICELNIAAQGYKASMYRVNADSKSDLINPEYKAIYDEKIARVMGDGIDKAHTFCSAEFGNSYSRNCEYDIAVCAAKYANMETIAWLAENRFFDEVANGIKMPGYSKQKVQMFFRELASCSEQKLEKVLELFVAKRIVDSEVFGKALTGLELETVLNRRIMSFIATMPSPDIAGAVVMSNKLSVAPTI